MSTEWPETPDEARQVVRNAAGEISRKYHDLALETDPDSTIELVYATISNAFEDLWQELER